MIQVIEKSGKRLTVIAEIHGTPLTRICTCASCATQPKSMRFVLLPCGCHSAHVRCTCKVHDYACHGCGKVFVSLATRFGKEVYQVEDPHA